MNRARALFFFALASSLLAACSVIVNGKLRERVASCDGQTDGTPCLGADYCVNAACVFASCGDGVVTQGEQCDDGNGNAFDGCNTFCHYSCMVDADCDDGQVCNGAEHCTAQHACANGAPADPSTVCTPDAGGSGNCDGAGLCVAAGCGNGTVEAPEDCDPPDPLNGCRADCHWVCSSNFDCPTNDPCNDNQQCDPGTHLCTQAPPPSCDDADACSSDSCSGSAGCAHRIIDGDGDGYAPLPAPLGACAFNPSYFGGDCDDTRSDTHPGAVDLCNDGIDQDCSGTADDMGSITCYQDADGDGFGNPSVPVNASCGCPQGYVSNAMGSDCDDLDIQLRPNYPGELPRWTAVPACAGKAEAVDKGGGYYTCSDDSTPIWDVDCDQRVDVENTQTAGLCRLNLLDQMCGGSGFASVPDCGQTATFTACERSCGTVCTCKTFDVDITQRCH